MTQGDDVTEGRFLNIANRIASDAGIDAVGAALIAALHLGIGADSRSLANRLGIAHALVLREISMLSEQFIHIEKRDTRTRRTFIALTPHGETIAANAVKAGAEP